jgi:hypothetical protein
LLSDTIGGVAMIGEALSIVCVTVSLLAAIAFAIGQRFLGRTDGIPIRH